VVQLLGLCTVKLLEHPADCVAVKVTFVPTGIPVTVPLPTVPALAVMVAVLLV
jgi:hypothetical protein